ncbi:MAG TPA: VWA domain-containing protein [Bryobacteraceae bacterium]|nr:VWA domain-containing protein [Bryobacteraceae bacterium]HOQ46022.1 VWA domain-containing protein [Bryobacteraceae bacterium]HPU72868.1 VWA domain-containing protein [Bryobacteraceae bacterium]
MTVERPWLALLALVPLIWAAYSWRGASRRGALVLKALGLAAVLLALAEPRLEVFESRVAVAVLVDTSSSLSPQDLQRASELARALESSRGRNWVHVMPFAQSTRRVTAAEREEGRLKLGYTAGEAGRSTDIEAALREGISALPANRVPRLVLISDGLENLGSVTRAVWQARQLGIPIDTYALNGRPKPDLRLESVTLPAQAFSGEHFPVDVIVVSPQRTRATVTTSADQKVLGSNQVVLEPGPNQLRVHASIRSTGAVDFSGSISAPGLGEVRFAQALSLRRPRVLFVSQDPPGTEVHILRTLEAAQFEVVQAQAIPSNLADYQILALNNWDLTAVPEQTKEQVEEFVKQGGGLISIGGERNIYVDKKGAPEDPLERTLPAKIAPPRTPEGTCVVLILDKSSSMEGRKMELARLSAIGVVENLRPIDYVGVLIFDNSFHWAVPIRRAEEKTLIKRVIAGIMPDGGTQIAPALTEAYRRILSVRAVYKHIVLLTDGISEEGDSMSLAREASQRQITISTVGLGQDVNRSYLERVASLARGKSYFLSDPSGLEQILLRDVMEHTGSTAVERNIRPAVMKNVEILEGVGMETAPPLLGYVRFEPKPTADVILNADIRDPLLVRWQYGLGRAGVFTSDAKSRWARNWVNWEGFDRFWGNVFRDLLPHTQAGEAKAEYNSATGELVVDYHLGRYIEEPAKVPDVFVIGPQGFQRPVKVEKVAAGAYRGRVRIDHRKGLFRVRPLVESRAFPEVGFYRQEEELTQYGSDEQLLKRISEFTGGRFNPAPRDVFDPGGRTVASTMRLWPGLLILAVLLNLIELTLRKWRGIADRLGGLLRRRAAPA